MRSRIVVLVMLLVFAVAVGVQAEGAGIVAKGIKAGINIAGHRGSDTDDHHKSRTGFIGGGFLTYMFTPALGLQPELLYSQKGFKWEDGDWKETGKFTYLEIPVLVKYMIPMDGAVMPNLYAGVAPAFLMSAKVDWEDNYSGMGVILGDSGTDDYKDDSSSFDIGLVFGGGVNFSAGEGLLMFDVRYTMGMIDVPDVEEDYDIKNKAITIMAGYGFK
ncbi:porin family protein [Candidatus Eisenbacteria bacterium]|uniref:Porin family protein n=1 Tax=Eiseniibacteriota bacterium TaxID=2212470 RepID=A0ABV6YPP4_UNCEI